MVVKDEHLVQIVDLISFINRKKKDYFLNLVETQVLEGCRGPFTH